jgi:hypothetical protein
MDLICCLDFFAIAFYNFLIIVKGKECDIFHILIIADDDWK